MINVINYRGHHQILLHAKQTDVKISILIIQTNCPAVSTLKNF